MPLRPPTAVSWLTAAVVSGLAAPLALPAAATITYTTLALSGDLAPGTGGGFTSFNPPNVNDQGEVVFAGSANAFSELGLWRVDSGGATELVMRALDPIVPGSSLVFATTFQNWKIADNGDVGAYHRLADTSSSYDSLWRGAPGSYGLVALDDDDDSAFAGTGRHIMLFDDGTTAFRAIDDVVPGGLNEGGLYFSPGGLVASEDLTAPGTGVAFERLFEPAAANRTGQILFLGDLFAPSSSDRGLWRASSAGAELVAREGDPVPGLGSDVYSSFNFPAIADTGEVTFSFVASGSATTRGIMSGAPGSLAILAKTGDPAPDPALPGSEHEIFYEVRMSGSGDVAFVSFYDDAVPGGELGLFSVIDGVQTLVAKEGDVAPGTGGALFTSIDDPIINDLGQVVFLGQTSGGQDGLWALHGDGLERVVATGDLMDLGGGDVREVVSYGFLADPSLQLGALGDGGHVAFSVVFDDNSWGVFSAQLVPVPEPSMTWLVAAGGLGLAVAASRRNGARIGEQAKRG